VPQAGENGPQARGQVRFGLKLRLNYSLSGVRCSKSRTALSMRTTAAGIFVFNIPADFHKHLMSAFGGKADIEISGRDVCF
jgi:hypothetical protein